MNSEGKLRKKELELKEKYPVLWRLLEILQESRQNPMILHNFVRECIFENIKKDIFESIMETLNQCFEGTKYLAEEDVDEIPGKIIEFLAEKFGEDYPFFLGAEIHEKDVPDYVCHYKSYNDFWMICSISKEWTRLIDTNEDVKKLKEELREKLRKKEKIPVEHLEGIVINGGHRKFFWICRKKSDRNCYCDDEKAQEIIEKLGMTVREGDDLVEFCIPKSEIRELYCPTMFDNAFDNDYFRTQYREDHWGETVNVSPDRAEGFKGLLQAVCRPVSVKGSDLCIIGCFRKNDDPPDLKDLHEESLKELINMMR